MVALNFSRTWPAAEDLEVLPGLKKGRTCQLIADHLMPFSPQIKEMVLNLFKM